MRKKFLVFGLLALGLFANTSSVFADTFSYSSSQSLYAGGHISPGAHWTEYRLNSPYHTIGATIKVKNNPTEVNSGVGRAYVKSKYYGSPLEPHVHTKINYD